MSHFDKYLPVKLFSRLESGKDGNSNSGSIELWFPYITLNTTRKISESMARLATNEFDALDQEIFSIFFHEYIHLIQSACFPLCHIPVEFTYCYIFDAHTTAKKRKAAGIETLLPIEHSKVFEDACDKLFKTYAHTTIVEGIHDDIIELSVVHILEGVARILEERYLGQSLPPDELYDTLRDVNEAIFAGDSLDDRTLLEFAEQAMRYEHPDEMLVRLLIARRDGLTIYEPSCWNDQAELDMILQDGKGVLSSSYFNELRSFLERFYRDTPKRFAKGAVFTSIYDSIEKGERKCLPTIVIDNISRIGLPVVAYQSGELEAFNPYDDSAKVCFPLRSFEGVCKILLGVGDRECSCLINCEAAQRSGVDGVPHVDNHCLTDPWAKDNGGELCPFTAAWRAFHFENLKRGILDGEDVSIRMFYDQMLLRYKPGEVFGCEVRIWSNDSGNKPHIHITTKNAGRKERRNTTIDCCVRLDVAEYFVHGGHDDTLNNSQCKELYQFLQQKNKRHKEKTNWDVLVEEWNNHYPARMVPKGTSFPDYSALNG